jgi:uncharacterized iron-regulated protein
MQPIARGFFRWTRPARWAALPLLLAGCALPPSPPLPRTDAPLLLLGEVHDNRAGHALRLQALQRLVAQGRRPVLLMEAFDRERQAEIDRLLQAAPGMPPGDAEWDAGVDALVKLGGSAGGGWDWDLYRPVLRLALQHRLPIVAANVSRAEARRVVQQGLGPAGFPSEVPADITRAQAEAIEQSHCGAVDAAMANRLAQAQVARDQFMARQLAAAGERGVVLLAGNGHVRRDIGVPRWLDAGLRERCHAVGYLETGDDSAAAYDEVVFAAPQPRPDPCAGLRGSTMAASASAPAPASR